MSAPSQIDPHNKMRARDLNKVARGEQAPRPAHEYGSINSAPPKPSAESPPLRHSHHADDQTIVVEDNNPTAMHCYAGYIQYHKCIKEEVKGAPKCERFEKNYKFLCPVEWIERWGMKSKNLECLLVQFK